MDQTYMTAEDLNNYGVEFKYSTPNSMAMGHNQLVQNLSSTNFNPQDLNSPGSNFNQQELTSPASNYNHQDITPPQNFNHQELRSPGSNFNRQDMQSPPSNYNPQDLRSSAPNFNPQDLRYPGNFNLDDLPGSNFSPQGIMNSSSVTYNQQSYSSTSAGMGEATNEQLAVKSNGLALQNLMNDYSHYQERVRAENAHINQAMTTALGQETGHVNQNMLAENLRMNRVRQQENIRPQSMMPSPQQLFSPTMNMDVRTPSPLYNQNQYLNTSGASPITPLSPNDEKSRINEIASLLKNKTLIEQLQQQANRTITSSQKKTRPLNDSLLGISSHGGSSFFETLRRQSGTAHPRTDERPSSSDNSSSTINYSEHMMQQKSQQERIQSQKIQQEQLQHQQAQKEQRQQSQQIEMQMQTQPSLQQQQIQRQQLQRDQLRLQEVEKLRRQQSEELLKHQQSEQQMLQRHRSQQEQLQLLQHEPVTHQVSSQGQIQHQISQSLRYQEQLSRGQIQQKLPSAGASQEFTSQEELHRQLPLHEQEQSMEIPTPSTPHIDDMSSKAPSNKNKGIRYTNTMNALQKAGLLDITIQTAELVKKNDTLQKDIDMLEEIVKVTKHLMNES